MAVPWSALASPTTLGALSLPHWKQLGFTAGAGPDQIRKQLRTAYPGVPAFILRDDWIRSLDAWARHARQMTLRMARPNGGGDGPDIDPGGLSPDDGTPLPPAPAPSPPVPIDMPAFTVFDLAVQVADCFLNRTEWSMQWPWGVRMCMDRPCTDKLELLLSNGSINSTELFTLINNLVRAGLVFVEALISPWLLFAIAHFSLYWSVMIRATKGPNGICLVHVFPWWSGLSGGVFHGWGEPR